MDEVTIFYQGARAPEKVMCDRYDTKGSLVFFRDTEGNAFLSINVNSIERITWNPKDTKGL